MSIPRPKEYDYNQGISIKQMKENLERMKQLATQEIFTDDDYREISDMSAASQYLPGRIFGNDYASIVSLGYTYKSHLKESIIYYEGLRLVYNQIDKFGNTAYYDWFSFNYQNPRPENFHSAKKYKHILKESDRKEVKCYVCKYTDLANQEDGIFGGGGMEAYFITRIDTKYTPEPGSICNNSYKENIGKRIKWGCCFHSDVRPEPAMRDSTMSGSCTISVKINHCTLHCDCFSEKTRGANRLRHDKPQMVTGGYGSCYDCGYLQYLGPDENFCQGKNICDWCIHDLIYKNELKVFVNYDE
jgi:hypothetical protein